MVAGFKGEARHELTTKPLVQEPISSDTEIKKKKKKKKKRKKVLPIVEV